MAGKGDTPRSCFSQDYRDNYDAIFRKPDDPATISLLPSALHVIPLMDHPYAKHWEQPYRGDIILNETHAFMSERTLKQLLDYSQSQPSGDYPGKMWRAADRGSDQWYLKWFDVSPKGDDYCSTKTRKIVIA